MYTIKMCIGIKRRQKRTQPADMWTTKSLMLGRAERRVVAGAVARRTKEL